MRYTPNLYTPPLHSLAALKQTEKKKKKEKEERENRIKPQKRPLSLVCGIPWKPQRQAWNDWALLLVPHVLIRTSGRAVAPG